MSFSKTGRSRFLSHLEVAAALTRALKRSPLQPAYSAGFHPHPKISFATATPVGMESAQEYMDVTASEYLQDLSALQNIINAALPAGIRVTDIHRLAYTARDLAKSLYGFSYDLVLPEDTTDDQMKGIGAGIQNFLARETFEISRTAKGKNVTRNIRPFVETLILRDSDKKVEALLRHAQSGSVRPVDIIQHILGYDADETHRVTIIKTKTVLV
jgi:radical SAM-linked protein